MTDRADLLIQQLDTFTKMHHPSLLSESINPGNHHDMHLTTDVPAIAIGTPDTMSDELTDEGSPGPGASLPRPRYDNKRQ